MFSMKSCASGKLNSYKDGHSIQGFSMIKSNGAHGWNLYSKYDGMYFVVVCGELL